MTNDERALEIIKQRLAVPIFLIGWIPMTIEQAEQFLFAPPAIESDQVCAIPYWLSNSPTVAKPRPYVDNTGDDGGF